MPRKFCDQRSKKTFLQKIALKISEGGGGRGGGGLGGEGSWGGGGGGASPTVEAFQYIPALCRTNLDLSLSFLRGDR